MDKFKLADEIFKTECKNDKLNKEGETFIQVIEKKISRVEKKYIKVIQSLEPDECEKGSQWLFHIEQGMIEKLII